MRSFSIGKEIYHHGNHPIKWVRITGVIIAVDEFSARRVFTIDDSSGVCIECTCPAPPPSDLAVPAHLDQALGGGKPVNTTVQTPKAGPATKPSTPSVETPLVPWEDMDVGVVVKIKGKPNKFRDVKQIDIIKVEVIRSTEQEVRCWNEVLAFRVDVLRVPWVVSKEVEDKYRRRAERGKAYRHKSKTHGESSRDKKGEEIKSNSKDKVKQKQKKSDHSSEDREKEERRGSKKRKPDLEEGLKAKNKANYPSLAVRRMLAGKYDALGI
jgi:hypothetical protein